MFHLGDTDCASQAFEEAGEEVRGGDERMVGAVRDRPMRGFRNLDRQPPSRQENLRVESARPCQQHGDPNTVFSC
jgi:hypothetical protein